MCDREKRSERSDNERKGIVGGIDPQMSVLGTVPETEKVFSDCLPRNKQIIMKEHNQKRQAIAVSSMTKTSFGHNLSTE